ncbi:M23 family metallopeptidase [Corallococcus sp. bb12-1]|uniref:M23 family metallopeptidase n=1 Tax=Corallococcus sp. bb12-1 TaxID=2996784 RepID=UPI00226DC50F|nr:M23 family metallopeptidase [Corallococcus sp. bb12-1]MCY1040744.1 M23 family metallopeptidase [Corallococcus sp. bb12-1]
MSSRLRSAVRLTAVAVATVSVGASAQTYAFPGSSADLPDGSHWWISSDHDGTENRDLKAARFDASVSKFTGVKIPFADYAVNPKNSDWVIYGLPVSAIADGEVITCWRNAPEGLKPAVHGGDDVPNPGRAANPPTIPRSGNHLNIRTSDGKVILYAHMQPGSIPEALCPFNATNVVNAEDRIGDLPREVMVPAAQRAFVKRGQFIGRVGSSGASSGPHLHVHMKPMLSETTMGESLPLTFSQAWQKDGAVAYDSSLDFVPLRAEALNQFPSAIHPDPLLRRGSITGDAAMEVAMTSSGDTVVTATRDTSGRLVMGSWRLAGDGTFTKLSGTTTADASTYVSIANPGLGRDVVTAARDADGKLQLTAWRVSSGGSFSRQAEAGGDVVSSQMALASMPGGSLGVVSAVRDSAGRLKVSTWETSATLDTITRRGNGFGEDATQVSLAAVANGRVAGDTGSSFKGVVTAVRTPAGKLSVTAWEIGSTGLVYKRGTYLAGDVADVAISSMSITNVRDLVVVSARLPTGVLRNISFDITTAGQLVRRDDEDAGGVSDVQAARVVGQHLVTSVRDSAGNLRVFTWDVDANSQVHRTGQELAGDILDGMAVTSTYVGARFVITAVRLAASGDVRLIAWDANLP